MYVLLGLIGSIIFVILVGLWDMRRLESPPLTEGVMGQNWIAVNSEGRGCEGCEMGCKEAEIPFSASMKTAIREAESQTGIDCINDNIIFKKC